MRGPARLCCLLMLWTGFTAAQDHAGHAMDQDAAGSVMNGNTGRLPRDCASLNGDLAFTVHAGREYAVRPGLIFGMSRHEWRVPPCSRIQVTFVNEDSVRHQWMVHGLPRYLYPGGMFHIEVAGGHRRTGTFIVPGDNRTFLVHCDLPQHMEKGMRGQLVVGRGSGNLWGVPGVSDDFRRADYLPRWLWLAAALAVIAGGVVIRLMLPRV